MQRRKVRNINILYFSFKSYIYKLGFLDFSVYTSKSLRLSVTAVKINEYFGQKTSDET